MKLKWILVEDLPGCVSWREEARVFAEIDYAERLVTAANRGDAEAWLNEFIYHTAMALEEMKSEVRQTHERNQSRPPHHQHHPGG
jgi:hypothetical protein